VTQTLTFESGYVAQLPEPHRKPDVEGLAETAVGLKSSIVSTEPTEAGFRVTEASNLDSFVLQTAAVLHAIEGVVDLLVFKANDYEAVDIELVTEETGTPVGWFPLISGYDRLPELRGDVMESIHLPQGLAEALVAHRRISPPEEDIVRLKSTLGTLYEAGPGGQPPEGVDASVEDNTDDDEDTAVSGARIPVPAETFLEELSQNLQIHPISVYWLLEELRTEGLRCKPEEQRLLEDRLSVMMLRLLGHRWPKQIEAGEAVPEWADADGIIPHTSGAVHSILAERVRERLQVEDGLLGTQRVEVLLSELTELSLEGWLRTRFFTRHVRQFKHRPVAWHLASTPQGGGKKGKAVKRAPAFECIVYYHACGGDVLARIISQYVQPLYLSEQRRIEEALQAKDEVAVARSRDRAEELLDFMERLRQVADRGFASAELDTLLASEPLDRWSGDGYIAPASHNELLASERAWRVDINDGVRVNIAPIQLAGLLAQDVLKAADVRKAIEDRAKWRADERRWVREGKLPRCGWMGEDVPESTCWKELATRRAEDAAKLKKKRKAALFGTA
jgi:hypothetical protein